MKSSGGLRLIHKKEILDSLSLYCESLQWIDLQKSVTGGETNTLCGWIGVVLNAWTIDSIFNTNFEKPFQTPPLLTTDKKSINKFAIHYTF
jgi:hypothetical protein